MIVDDEPLAREGLRELLRGEEDISIVGEAEDGIRAIEEIRKKKADLIFLDIQMPEFDGFEVLKAVGPASSPVVIFVTAFDEYAVRAFEVRALDYLLKPVNPVRLGEALDRARRLLHDRRGKGSDDFPERLAGLVADISKDRKPVERFLVKSSGRLLILKADEIDWIGAEGDYIGLHVQGKKHLIKDRMNSLEEQLHPGRFVRIHRSYIVNIDRIREMQPLFHGEYALLLRDGQKLTLSRSYRDQALGRIKQPF